MITSLSTTPQSLRRTFSKPNSFSSNKYGAHLPIFRSTAPTEYRSPILTV